MITEELTAHCSNHVYFSSGCGDCSTAALFQIMHGSKLQKKRYDIHHLAINPAQPTPHIQLLRSQLHSVLRIFLSNAKLAVIKAAKQQMSKLVKAGLDRKEFTKVILDSIEWDELITDVSSDLSQTYETATKEGLAQLSMKLDYSEVSSSSKAYAEKRAAEMIGKKFVDGKLVDNPNAKYVISDTTRDDLKDLIAKAFSEQSSFDEFEKSIKLAGAFSDARANMIARTEIAMAQVRGNLDVWKSSGIVKTVDIVLSANHKDLDECDVAANSGPYQIHSVPLLPIHPLCSCGYLAVELSEQ